MHQVVNSPAFIHIAITKLLFIYNACWLYYKIYLWKCCSTFTQRVAPRWEIFFLHAFIETCNI